jgi:hypothetical protein
LILVIERARAYRDKQSGSTIVIVHPALVKTRKSYCLSLLVFSDIVNITGTGSRHDEPTIDGRMIVIGRSFDSCEITYSANAFVNV